MNSASSSLSLLIADPILLQTAAAALLFWARNRLQDDARDPFVIRQALEPRSRQVAQNFGQPEGGTVPPPSQEEKKILLL